jgi:hypothetical protein
VKEIPKWISIILSKNIVDVNNLRMKRQLDPTSAEALKQYWNWKKPYNEYCTIETTYYFHLKNTKH